MQYVVRSRGIRGSCLTYNRMLITDDYFGRLVEHTPLKTKKTQTNVSVVFSSNKEPPNKIDCICWFTLVNGANGILNLLVLFVTLKARHHKTENMRSVLANQPIIHTKYVITILQVHGKEITTIILLPLRKVLHYAQALSSGTVSPLTSTISPH